MSAAPSAGPGSDLMPKVKNPPLCSGARRKLGAPALGVAAAVRGSPPLVWARALALLRVGAPRKFPPRPCSTLPSLPPPVRFAFGKVLQRPEVKGDRLNVCSWKGVRLQ